jgi:CheY-like chemotaxis protein
MSANTDPKLIEAFTKYLGERKILIADPNRSSRTGVARTLNDMGAKTSNMTLCDQYDSAFNLIKEIKPDIVVADYDFGKGGGLILIQEQRLNSLDNKLALSIIMTGNTSQSAVAQAAEEDVDSFILKPYTVDTLKKCILSAALIKLFPSDYLKTVEEGKIALFAGEYSAALKTFEKAKGLDPKPTLACFYAGQAELMQKLMSEAGKNYETGLGFNKIHYKCLVGLFDLLMERKSYQEAYDCMKKVAQYFPANPKRLSSVIRLAIMTRSIEDMEKYYQIFTNIEIRSEELTRYICAGLIVCGRYYLKTGSKVRAVDLFTKTAVSGAGNVKFLKEIVCSLVEYKCYKDAESFLARFPSHAQSGLEFYSSQYYLDSKQKPPTFVVEQGRQLLKDDRHDPLIYECLIRASMMAKLEDHSQTLVAEASKRWPEQSCHFAALAVRSADKLAV